MKPINFMQNDGFRKQTLYPSYVNPECKNVRIIMRKYLVDCLMFSHFDSL